VYKRQRYVSPSIAIIRENDKGELHFVLCVAHYFSAGEIIILGLCFAFIISILSIKNYYR